MVAVAFKESTVAVQSIMINDDICHLSSYVFIRFFITLVLLWLSQHFFLGSTTLLDSLG
jgi:hypothetical protein